MSEGGSPLSLYFDSTIRMFSFCESGLDSVGFCFVGFGIMVVQRIDRF